MAKVLGRVTGAIDVPRGPDALYRVHVPSAWLEEGATIELELPRNLTCSACQGGGCDACDRAGAVTIRDRKDPAETVRVTLPQPAESSSPPSSGKRGLVVRIPERGGHPPGDSNLPRGNLMLVVLEGEEAGPGIRRIEPELPLVIPVAPLQPERAPRSGRRRGVMIGIIALIVWILFLLWLRVTGRG